MAIVIAGAMIAAVSPWMNGSQDRALSAPAPREVKLFVNSVKMKLTLIPKGSFTMGSPAGETGRQSNEGPQHEVKFPRPFYMGVFLVTQAQYKEVMGKNPSWYAATGRGEDRVRGMATDEFPVEMVSWNDAVKFCEKLSAMPAEKKVRRVYRLPTEAEWEYACRAGTKTQFHFGNSLDSTQANMDGSQPYDAERTAKVGSYKPNAWGLYDMHGNVWKWTADWFGQDYYAKSPKENPQGPPTGRWRVLRGGALHNDSHSCRSAYRLRGNPDDHCKDAGFRVVCTTVGK
jgi:formylglycine-generating enzyme required for sulfatase activity